MKVVISVIRPFHFVLLANTLIRNHHAVTIWSGAPRKFFNGLSDEARTHLIPAPLAILGRLFHTKFPSASILREAIFWDTSVAAVLGSPDVFVGLATLALYSGKRAKHKGARFVLDRACPHVDFQQKLLQEESEKIGSVFTASPEWFRERQIQEYEEADAILVPSYFTASSFPS